MGNIMNIIEIRRSAYEDANKLQTNEIRSYITKVQEDIWEMVKTLEEKKAIIEGYKDALYSR